MTYKINEIFYSLQGEGANAGTPAVFVRFSGCNLRCSFCDTDFNEYTEMTAEEILDRIGQYPSNFVVLTGGEPSLQTDDALLEALHEQDYVIAIETNGTRELPFGIDWVTVSPKEGSKVVLQEADEVKVVYTGQDVVQYLDINAECYYLQPCWKDGHDNREEVIAYCLEHPEWSLSVQLHKILNIK